jgi:predicted DNA-binding transcriptional regulator AlpA
MNGSLGEDKPTHIRVADAVRSQGIPTQSGAKPYTLSEVELAERLSISRKTLQKWRSLGMGPAYLKLGAKVVYRVEDIEAYIKRSLRLHRV